MNETCLDRAIGAGFLGQMRFNVQGIRGRSLPDQFALSGDRLNGVEGFPLLEWGHQEFVGASGFAGGSGEDDVEGEGDAEVFGFVGGDAVALFGGEEEEASGDGGIGNLELVEIVGGIDDVGVFAAESGANFVDAHVVEKYETTGFTHFRIGDGDVVDGADVGRVVNVVADGLFLARDDRPSALDEEGDLGEINAEGLEIGAGVVFDLGNDPGEAGVEVNLLDAVEVARPSHIHIGAAIVTGCL
jgi:hypothetical protein